MSLILTSCNINKFKSYLTIPGWLSCVLLSGIPADVLGALSFTDSFNISTSQTINNKVDYRDLIPKRNEGLGIQGGHLSISGPDKPVVTVGPSGKLISYNLAVGKDNVPAIVNIDGGTIELQRRYETHDPTRPGSINIRYDIFEPGLTNGAGIGSASTLIDAGSVLNVINGGILSDDADSGVMVVGFGASPIDNPVTTVNVHGPNSKIMAPTIYLGAHSNSIMNITDGGIVQANTVEFGSGHSQGDIVVSGEGSALFAKYNIKTAVSPVNLDGSRDYDFGSILIKNKGELNTPKLDLGVAGKRTVNNASVSLDIGGHDNETPQEPGILNVTDIVLGQYTSTITLNHTGKDFNLKSNISRSTSRLLDPDRPVGIINAMNGTTNLSGDNSGFDGQINISSAAQINVNSKNNIGGATVTNNGVLGIASATDWVFDTTMSGNGILDVNTAGNAFSFRNTTDTLGFTGALKLSDTTFNLSDTNTSVLSAVSLSAGTGSLTNVGVGTQSIKDLAFNGGAIDFGAITQGAEKTDSQITVTGNLDVSGNGAIRISTPADVNGIPQTINSSLSLLELDDSNATIRLVDAGGGTVTGNAGSLQLQDTNGMVISSGKQQDIVREGKTVAKGTYDYRLTSGADNDGLYINYGLTQLELLTSGSDALTLNADGNTGNAADMSALITGSGDLAFDSQKGEIISLSNQNNKYTGITDVRRGNLLMNNDNVLGKTSEIHLATDTILDMNGHSQTAGKLNGASGSVLNINGGNLTLEKGGISAGKLTGSGSLNVGGGVFDVAGTGDALTANISIAEKATVQVHNSDGLGKGRIDTAGSLILGKPNSPVLLTNSEVNIARQGILSGFGGVSGNVTNSGTLDLRADAPGNVLTVGGNYTGNNGTLLMNTVLGDDSSATDKLVIKGDASGQTRVEVTKAGGTGAQTLNGIELIHVEGNADSAEFVQAGRIAAGAYDYRLGRGQGSNSGNWYLTSGKNTPDPDSKPEPAPGGYDNDLRPEAGSYTANMAAANTMFVTRLHDRLGPVQYTDVMTGETKNTSMWMRHEGGHNRWRDGTGQLKTQGNRYVVQLGGDIAQWGWGETDRWHLGVMAGYGNDHNNTDSVRTGYRSKGSVNGYSTGLYATWFANDETHNGAYLDTWAQYGWFDNHVKGDGLPGESWKSKGLTASLETGYTWKAGEFSGSHGSLNEWYVQPQAQVVWMGVKADEHRESNGTRVESTGDGNVRTRLGVKTWIKGHNRMDDGKSREFRPFVEVNWLHNTRDFGTRMNGVTVYQDGARNIGEVKAGVEGQINDRLNLWGNVGVQAGDKGYSDTSAMLGVKYTF
ncbi:autotransporter outer membrane beta-barrel domain-containing protein [Escherichia coli]|nr:autotransporter outer membrane beta-barrel domain-containing protein [Escherichia coli]